jgi:hypothetical protein
MRYQNRIRKLITVIEWVMERVDLTRFKLRIYRNESHNTTRIEVWSLSERAIYMEWMVEWYGTFDEHIELDDRLCRPELLFDEQKNTSLPNKIAETSFDRV